jgi:hypothetical protein
MCQHIQRIALDMEQNKKATPFCFASRDLGRMPGITHNDGAHNKNRTCDLFLTKEVLYHLSYMSLKPRLSCVWSGWRESNPRHQLGRLR